MLGALAADLRASPLLTVLERWDTQSMEKVRPDVVLVDAAQTTAEQFRDLIALCPTLLSVDPETYQLNMLSSPPQADLTEMARMIETISLTLHPPA
jgi:hypothetical protein